MTVDFEKLRAVFDAAVERHTPEQWSGYLDQVCAGDEELRCQAAVLLEAHAQGHGPLDLDELLDQLASADPRAAELVKLRFFAGLTGDQVAEILGIAPRSADLLWAYARAWLFEKLQGGSC